MFYVNENLRFGFYHDIFVGEDGRPHGTTICTIEKPKLRTSTEEIEWRPISHGKARCGTEDVFSRATGRKIALTRALDNRFYFDKNDRTEIWETYFKNVKAR